MRISHLFGCAVLALSSASLQAATSDAQAKCEQQLTAQQGNLETGKMLGQMLGNEKLSNAIAQVEGGCAQLNGEELRPMPALPNRARRSTRRSRP
jgi:hypothetical protein